MKKIAILGSTGSIGTQTLEIVREQKDIFVLLSQTVSSSSEYLGLMIRDRFR